MIFFHLKAETNDYLNTAVSKSFDDFYHDLATTQKN